MRKRLLLLAVMALLATVIVPLNSASAQTHDERKLGKRFASLGAPASGWSTAYTPGSSEYWRTGGFVKRSYREGEVLVHRERRNMTNLREEAVFYGALTHNDPDPMRDYQLRVGKGSQIYSIITNYGEVIAPQYNECGSMHYWTDPVLQRVFRPTDEDVPRYKKADHCTPTSRNGRIFDQKNWFYNKNADIHQAGTYQTDNLSTAFFSPMVFSANTRHSISTAVWPPAAHAPTDHESNLLVEQVITDMSPNNERGTAGVVKIETTTHNSGPLAMASGLWSSFNANLFDLDPSTDADQAYMWTSIVDAAGEVQPKYCSAKFNCSAPEATRKKSNLDKGDGSNNFGGIVALGRPLDGQRGDGEADEAWGMAIAIGTQFENVKMGSAFGAGLVLTAAMDDDIGPGQTQTYTYYLVFDRLDRALEKAKQYVASARVRTFDAQHRPTAKATAANVDDLSQKLRVPLCSGSLRGSGWDSCRDVRSDGRGGVTRAYVYNRPVRDGGKKAVPVFVLRRSGSNEFHVTSDPYGRTHANFTALETANTAGWQLRWRVDDDDRVPLYQLPSQVKVLRPYGSETPTEMRELLGYAFKGKPRVGCYQPINSIPSGLPAGVTAESDLYVACR